MLSFVIVSQIFVILIIYSGIWLVLLVNVCMELAKIVKILYLT